MKSYPLMLALLTAPLTAQAANEAAPPDEMITEHKGPAFFEFKPLSPTSVEVTVTFAQETTLASIQLRGDMGLKLKSEELQVKDRTFKAGEVYRFVAYFTPGEGQSVLHVKVNGVVNQHHRFSNGFYNLGQPSAAQKAERDRGIHRADDGTLIQISNE